jgi:hypothetical protein
MLVLLRPQQNHTEPHSNRMNKRLKAVCAIALAASHLPISSLHLHNGSSHTVISSIKGRPAELWIRLQPHGITVDSSSSSSGSRRTSPNTASSCKKTSKQWYIRRHQEAHTGAHRIPDAAVRPKNLGNLPGIDLLHGHLAEIPAAGETLLHIRLCVNQYQPTQ